MGLVFCWYGFRLGRVVKLKLMGLLSLMSWASE